MSKARSIYPVLMSGGAGSRLWPLSRANAPKQLLRLTGEETLLQQAARRLSDAELFAAPTVIGGVEHRFLLAEQLRQADASAATIVLEPEPRNTAAAAAVGALLVSRSQPDMLLLLMPTDLLIADAAAFRAAVLAAAEAARHGHLALFGVTPDRAATGYGYIRAGAPLACGGPARRVAAFAEKPSRELAESYLASGDYLWNSGIFLMPADVLLAELQAYEPELLAAAEEALGRATRDADFLRLDPEAFARCRSVAIDHAVMERTDKAAVVPAAFGWADAGSWSALWSAADRDASDTAAIGDVLTVATHGSYVRSDGPLVATLGIRDLIVVATDDAVLVAHKDRDQEVREIAERLRKEKRGKGCQ